jgi:hypothetical protein
MAEQEKPAEGKQVRIVWGSGENVPAHYANHLVVSFAGGTEFHLTFGHLSPPLTLGLDESELPDKLIVEPVAKIVASPDVMRAFVQLLKSNLENFEKMISQEEK